MSPRKFHFDEAQERRLIAAAVSGATERALAARFGCSHGVIQRKFKELRAQGRLGDAPHLPLEDTARPVLEAEP
ncbi:hypothetical protein [Methylovirgula sp. HY1]|uniref:hypothetical protein n=1 Tax=Methylovirgula sp. HY1 TaxID=2822761 RepID=UPI001C5B1E7A|nr:hypothetical protein [Methylovirgula sp. HY1]QXX74260.1 hypothetical protein MHY1_01070 [Methylovirgula sp. HY1]